MNRARFHEPWAQSSSAIELHCHPDYLERVFRKTLRCTLEARINNFSPSLTACVGKALAASGSNAIVLFSAL
jgi:hypothetical protein